MRSLAAIWRACGVLAHLLNGAFVIWWTFPKLSESKRSERVEDWSRTMLKRLAIELVVNGQPAQHGPMLLASNHISWLDIAVIHATRHCRFISKSEIKSWPLVGMLATGVGTLYIERESRHDAMRVVHHMAQALQAGDILAVFPEGTTGDGTSVLPFHANLLQAAITADAPVQPVALHFADRRTGKTSFAPCYIGDDTLLGSLWRTLSASDLQAVVNFGEPQKAQGRSRREWASDLRLVIADMRSGRQP
jgi:1-acyl-sn-glycerol-3-phosphate acyltransferase